jgi:hypothetical protein
MGDGDGERVLSFVKKVPFLPTLSTSILWICASCSVVPKRTRSKPPTIFTGDHGLGIRTSSGLAPGWGWGAHASFEIFFQESTTPYKFGQVSPHGVPLDTDHAVASL